MKNNRLLFLILSLGIFVGLSGIAGADGKFIQIAHVPKAPKIPHQRAIVKFQDGMETLIIESTLNGAGDRFGWIIPVPTTPIRIEQTTSGLLGTFQQQFRAEVVNEDQFEFWLTLALLIYVGIVMGLEKIRKGLGRTFIIVSVLFIIMAIVALPNFIVYRGGSYGKSHATVDVIQSQRVGVYDTAVIEAESAEDIDNWLIENEFDTLSGKALPVVEAYIREGWQFFVAKLNREDQTGAATPHPILLQFPVEKPVYPMRLTAMAANRLYLELYVVADGEAVPVNTNLQKEYCNTFKARSFLVEVDLNKEIEIKDYRTEFKGIHDLGSREFFRGRGGYRDGSRYDTIIHKTATDIMWHNCVVTKLTGTLKPNDMKNDYEFDFVDPLPYRIKKYSRVWAAKQSFMLTVWLIVPAWLTILILLRIFKHTFRRIHQNLGQWKIRAVIVLCTSLVVFSINYFTIGEKVSVRIFDQSRSEWNNYLSALSSFLSEPYLPFESVEETNRALRAAYPELHNPFTGAAVIVEDSPGNIYYVWTDDEIRALALYNRFGAAINFDGTYTDIDLYIKAKRLLIEKTNNVTTLVETLNNPDSLFRSVAAAALGRMGDQRAVQPLIDVLRDRQSSFDLQVAVCKALGRLGGPVATDTLALMLDSPVWFHAACALCSLQDERCIQPLMYALTDLPSAEREQTIDALSEYIGDESVDAIVSALNPVQHYNLRRHALKVLAKLATTNAVEPVMAVLKKDLDRSIRRQAANTLGEIGDNRAVNSLIIALQYDPDINVRVEAAIALKKLKNIESVDALIAMVNNSSNKRIRLGYSCS
jgi:HEAT repeat protein